ncbi:sensor histidine kinase [Cellulomonas xiejunii]|uniref:sensor histidine kinase n=1 Tax=Cellulomonas xiejunii TaxID=2968083 RepID=UPI001D0DE180|nr:histidine kinase [Cellulomonas xiejunii]MCC2314191.1 histidine kinase [Cellulomonas xiejunii]
MSTSPAAAAPDRRAAPWWRRWADTPGTAVAVLTAGFLGMAEVAFGVPSGPDVAPTYALLGFLLMLVAVAVGAALIWRRRLPVPVCLGTAAAAVLVPVGALAPLIALPWVLATAGRRTAAWCTAATGAAVVAAMARDWRREGDAVMWAAENAGGERTYLTGAGYVGFGAGVLAVAVVVGLVRRFRAAARSARRAADESERQAATLRAQAADLRTELTRQEERELIAREMHDTVAHQLSLVSLHAAALEVAADDPGTDVPEAARSMRSSAHRALDEMRALISSLRTVGGDSAERYGGPAPRLADLVALLDEARHAGVDIGATVFVDGGDDAPPALTRGVYRVVQESLTNAMKHAPGARVDVDLRARPGDGVDVVVSNPLVADVSATAGGAGLVGMGERAAALGGRFDAGPDDGRFVVRVHLPWPAPVPAPVSP